MCNCYNYKTPIDPTSVSIISELQSIKKHHVSCFDRRQDSSRENEIHFLSPNDSNAQSTMNTTAFCDNFSRSCKEQHVNMQKAVLNM